MDVRGQSVRMEVERERDVEETAATVYAGVDCGRDGSVRCRQRQHAPEKDRKDRNVGRRTGDDELQRAESREEERNRQ